MLMERKQRLRRIAGHLMYFGFIFLFLGSIVYNLSDGTIWETFKFFAFVFGVPLALLIFISASATLMAGKPLNFSWRTLKDFWCP